MRSLVSIEQQNPRRPCDNTRLLKIRGYIEFLSELEFIKLIKDKSDHQYEFTVTHQ